MPRCPDIPREISSIQVLIRFLVRMTLLGVFAAVGSEGVGKTFEALLLLSVFYCVFAAALRREMPFGPESEQPATTPAEERHDLPPHIEHPLAFFDLGAIPA